MSWTRFLKPLAVAAAVLVAAIVFHVQRRTIENLRQECSRYRHNTETLLGDVEFYKVQGLLSAARVEDLELTIREFRRFRSEDAALIESLQRKNRDLASVNKTQSETIIALQAIPRDTVIIRDSVPVHAVKVHCGDAWYDFEGLLTQEEFTGELQSRDSLLVAETVRYKRFLGFLWKTRSVKDRQIDVVSRNPHTQIMGIEHITISR